MLEHDPVISEYGHEKFRPREAEALSALRKIASLVKPIMRQRGWKVEILTEFYPPEKNLLGLNWNKGQKICLRLRYPHDEKQFLPLEEVVDTMLHELCHIVHGPHNDDFHNLWNQLRNEHEQLVRKGYTGEGFLSSGHKLGGARIPMQEARRRARAAAESRQVLAAGSGQKLGGAPVRRGEDIRKVIADAATRRSMVTKGCASGTERERGIVEETTKNGFRTKAEEDDANEEAIMRAYIELIQEEEREKYGKDYVAPSSTNPAGSKGDSKMASATSETVPPLAARRPLSVAKLPSDGWSCAVCTLYNPCGYLCCGACGCERSSSSTCPSIQIPTSHSTSSSASRHLTLVQRNSIESIGSIEANQNNRPLGWLCHICGTFMEIKWWTCSSCGCMKLSS